MGHQPAVMLSGRMYLISAIAFVAAPRTSWMASVVGLVH